MECQKSDHTNGPIYLMNSTPTAVISKLFKWIEWWQDIKNNDSTNLGTRLIKNREGNW